jgi:pimeloyl-ACP methyl ester carboxylesterase
MPIVVLFHGYAASKSALLSAALAFRDLGYATLLVDFYGSGGSSGSGTTIGVREADDVAAAAAYVQRTWPDRRIVLYGISMGGAAVLRAIAANGVKPDAVIIEATFDRLLNAGKNRFNSMGLPGSPFAELLLFWGSVQQGFNFFSHNAIAYARSVNCPVLVLHGEKDERTTVEQARGVAFAMGAKARFIAYADVPHIPIVDARGGDWKRDVQSFLQQLR